LIDINFEAVYYKKIQIEIAKKILSELFRFLFYLNSESMKR